jgi:chromosome segregation ATPase
MAFMKKDVNLGLLILIVVSLLLFGGFSVYYQTTFKDVSLECKEQVEQLSDVTKQLSSKRQELNETYSLRVKAEQDKQTLDVRYNEVRGENDNLKSDNTNLRSEVSSTKSQLAEKTVELGTTKSLLAQTQASLSAANSEITSLKSQKSNLKDEIDCLNVEAAKADADENIGSC